MSIHPSAVRLADILVGLEQAAVDKAKPAYRTLHNGLTLKVSLKDTGFELTIARPAPISPSTTEEQTCLKHLNPAVWGEWSRSSFVGGTKRSPKFYNISTLAYHR